MYRELNELREHMLSYIYHYYPEIVNRFMIPEKSTPDQAEHIIKKVICDITTEYVQSIVVFKDYPCDVTQLLDNIRSELEGLEYGIDNKDAVKNFFKGFRTTKTKVTPNTVLSGASYFLNMVKDKIDNEITWYLSEEAKVLKNAVERTDTVYDDD
jgi:hypothetical protein